MAQIELPAAGIGGIESIRIETDASTGGVTLLVFDDEGVDMMDLTPYQIGRIVTFLQAWEQLYSVADKH